MNMTDCRQLPQTMHVSIQFTSTYTDGQVAFKDLRKFHYNILCRSELKESGAEEVG